MLVCRHFGLLKYEMSSIHVARLMQYGVSFPRHMQKRGHWNFFFFWSNCNNNLPIVYYCSNTFSEQIMFFFRICGRYKCFKGSNKNLTFKPRKVH